MGCFLRCFGGAKEHSRRKHRSNHASPQTQQDRAQNVKQETIFGEELIIREKTPIDAAPELLNKPEGEEVRLSPSPRKKVTFDSNITTYEHVSLLESVDSLPECNTNVEKEKEEEIKSSLSEENPFISSAASFPENHRYHNSRESDDELEEEYCDSDLDDDDLDDDYGVDDFEEDIHVRNNNQDASLNSQHCVEKVMMLDKKHTSVLSPVENISQWKTIKSKGTTQVKPLKENLTANFEPPRVSFGSEQRNFKPKFSQLTNKEIAVDASLSNWLVSSENPSKTISSVSEGSLRSVEDRPILGAWTVDELRQISVSSSPRKSPSWSPDEMPIIGSVGSYWNNSDSASSYKGIPNTSSKYREDKRVNWHSTPFETRLDRALNHRAN